MPVSSPARDSHSWQHLLHTKVYRYQALLRKFWWLILLTTAVGLAAGAWKCARQQVVYVSGGRILVSGKINLHEAASYSEEMSNFLKTQQALMQDDTMRQRAEARVRTQFPEIPVTPVELSVAPITGTTIYNLTATGVEPRYPQKFLDALMKEFIATRREMRTQKSENTESAIADEIEKQQAELARQEGALLNFQRENNVGFLEQEGNSAGAYLAKLNTQLADLKKESQLLDLFELDQQVARDRQVTSAATKTGADSAAQSDLLAGAQHGPELEYVRARQQIEVLRAERNEYAKDLRPKHPIMVEFDRQIAEQQRLVDTFRRQSAEDLQHRREAIKLEVQNLESTIHQTETKALVLSQRLAEYTAIRAGIERQRTQLASLSTSKGTVEISRNVDQDIVSIRQDATAAQPAKPGAARTVGIGVALGLVVGLLLLILIDQFDDRVASYTEFQAHFPERVLAQIPTAPRPAGDVRLVPLAANDDRHAFAESFRSLRSSLIFLPVEGTPPKVLLITSAVPNEGKSTVAVNLAITLALSGLRVLLVDGDLRRGEIHRTFNLSNDLGLSDVLGGDCPLHSTVQATRIPGLSLLSRGSSVSNPGELYLSKEADRLLKNAYASYDYVVLDSSPIMAADDTTSLAPKADATLFVFRFTSSHIRVSRKALDLLRERQANIIGVVCNDVSEAMQEYYYYRYPEYYGAGAKEKVRTGT